MHTSFEASTERSCSSTPTAASGLAPPEAPALFALPMPFNISDRVELCPPVDVVLSGVRSRVCVAVGFGSCAASVLSVPVANPGCGAPVPSPFV